MTHKSALQDVEELLVSVSYGFEDDIFDHQIHDVCVQIMEAADGEQAATEVGTISQVFKLLDNQGLRLSIKNNS